MNQTNIDRMKREKTGDIFLSDWRISQETKTRMFSMCLYDEQIDFVESECEKRRLSMGSNMAERKAED